MTREDFLTRLLADPEDHGTHAVYADFLEESGWHEAARWHRGIAARHVLPWHTDANWWYWMRNRGGGIKAPCDLPTDLFALLVGKNGYHHGGFGIDSAKLYAAKNDAWRDLFRAVARLEGVTP